MMTDKQLKITNSTMKIGRKEAQAFIRNCGYDKQRNLREWHVQELADRMREGAFVPTTIIAICTLGNKRMLVNGQHTMHAVAQTGCEYEFLVQEYACDTEDDVSFIYSRFDVGVPRSERDVYNAMDVCAKFGITSMERSYLTGGVKVIARGFRPSSVQTDFRFKDKTGFQYGLMVEWLPYMKQVATLIEGGERTAKNVLKRCHIFGACMWIIRHAKDKQKAVEFIRGFAMNDGMRRGDPRKICLESIVNHRSEIVSTEIFCGAWNTFVRDEWSPANEKSTRQSISRYANGMEKKKKISMIGTKPVSEILTEKQAAETPVVVRRQPKKVKTVSVGKHVMAASGGSVVRRRRAAS
jgi:hypothetical protein